MELPYVLFDLGRSYTSKESPPCLSSFASAPLWLFYRMTGDRLPFALWALRIAKEHKHISDWKKWKSGGEKI
jgi:hypothetical protein